jgi:CheY-like chemotaxis protein
MLAENIFKRFRINYHKSFDRREALEKLAINQKFDCILMDYHMPQLDGYNTTKAIRAQASAYFKNVPIIALTANNDEIVKKKMFDAGAIDFIQKPLKIDQLIQIISTNIHQNQIQEF